MEPWKEVVKLGGLGVIATFFLEYENGRPKVGYCRLSKKVPGFEVASENHCAD